LRRRRNRVPKTAKNQDSCLARDCITVPNAPMASAARATPPRLRLAEIAARTSGDNAYSGIAADVRC